MKKILVSFVAIMAAASSAMAAETMNMHDQVNNAQAPAHQMQSSAEKSAIQGDSMTMCQRQDYWPFFAIFNVRYWSLMLSAFRHFIITDWRGVFCQHSRFAFFL